MPKRAFQLFLLAFAAVSGVSSEPQKPAVRLTVAHAVIFPKLTEIPKDFTAHTLYMVVAATLYIENVGTSAITVPTRTSHDGRPLESWTHSAEEGDSRGVYLIAMFDTHNGKKVQPSPSAFEPVTLQPGEQTVVGRWRPEEGYKDTLPSELSAVTFEYEVADDLATRFGWWSGKLRAKCNFVDELQKFKKPNQAPQPTPGS